MAYGLRLSGIGKDGSELFSIEPTWWPISELTKHIAINWITTNETGSYTDDDADISADETRVLHEEFKPVIQKLIDYNVTCIESCKTQTDEYAAVRLVDYTEYVSKLKADVQTIETALGIEVDKVAHFHLCVFEWDSGY